MEQQINTVIVLRNDSTSAWESTSYKLLKGEVGIEFSPEAGAANAKTKIKIGDGEHTWAELPYFGGDDAHVYEAVVAKGGNHSAAITEALANNEPNTHDVAIVKEALIEEELLSDAITQKYQQTAYRWNGEDWVAFDGNYSAKNVIFDEDFTFTTKIGTVQTLTNGSTTVAAAGKSVKDFFAGLFAAEDTPSKRKSDPSVSWVTEPKGTNEVGTEITPTYSAKLNAGEYTYGPATGITATSWNIDIADLADDNQATNAGTFTKFTLTDGMSGYAKITATATYGDGAIPVTNIGNKYDEDFAKNVRIKAGSKSVTSAGYTAYRTWFCGYRPGGSTLNIDNIDSATIRQDDKAESARVFARANGSFVTSMPTTNMQQMFFAAPKDVVASVEVSHSVNGAPQTVKKKTVYVKGANNYVTEDATNGMAYDLFYVSNDNPNSGDATYTIKTTKA